MLENLSNTWLAPLARPPWRLARWLRYRVAVARGRPAGALDYVWREWAPPTSWTVEVRLPAAAATAEEAADWCRRQSLRELRVAAYGSDGRVAWRADAEGELETAGLAPALWFQAPTRLPELAPAHLESSLLVIAAEQIDALLLEPDAGDSPGLDLASIDDFASPPARRLALFTSAAYAYEPASDAVVPIRDFRLAKHVPPAGTAALPREAATFGRRRRGPYLSSRPLPSLLRVGVRDAARLRRSPRPSPRPSLLVTASFLARGGAEHTLYETLRALADRFELAIVTLAPHRPELGDRREDFRELTSRVFCLGDWVHPAAMPGMLEAILDALDVSILYNANGTTLFYDFVPRLKERRPRLRILDHLYDHRIGYVDRYRPELLASVDACVAENRRIARVLVEERGWPAERVPVIRPCGRRASAFPAPEEAGEVRRRLRSELGYREDDVIVLTAARMHPQKRPLDLVELARRVRDVETLCFLIVGGGELEGEVDAAIARAAGARIRRLAFRTDIPALIVAADAGCLVSDYEGLPVFLLECLQAGRPFLGTDVGELGEVLRATGAGLVVERPGDLDALERQARRLADGEARAELARHARRAGRDYDVESCAERYARAFLGQPVTDGDSPPRGEAESSAG